MQAKRWRALENRGFKVNLIFVRVDAAENKRVYKEEKTGTCIEKGINGRDNRIVGCQPSDT